MKLGNLEGDIPVFGDGTLSMKCYKESGFLGLKP